MWQRSRTAARATGNQFENLRLFAGKTASVGAIGARSPGAFELRKLTDHARCGFRDHRSGAGHRRTTAPLARPVRQAFRRPHGRRGGSGGGAEGRRGSARAQGGGPQRRYGVAHANFVVAYTKDNLAHVIYPGGVGKDDWVHEPASSDSREPAASVRRARRAAHRATAGIGRAGFHLAFSLPPSACGGFSFTASQLSSQGAPYQSGDGGASISATRWGRRPAMPRGAACARARATVDGHDGARGGARGASLGALRPERGRQHRAGRGQQQGQSQKSSHPCRLSHLDPLCRVLRRSGAKVDKGYADRAERFSSGRPPPAP